MPRVLRFTRENGAFTEMEKKDAAPTIAAKLIINQNRPAGGRTLIIIFERRRHGLATAEDAAVLYCYHIRFQTSETRFIEMRHRRECNAQSSSCAFRR